MNTGLANKLEKRRNTQSTGSGSIYVSKTGSHAKTYMLDSCNIVALLTFTVILTDSSLKRHARESVCRVISKDPSGDIYSFTLQSMNTAGSHAFACSMTTKTVVDCLNNLFCLFVFPAYVHSDRGSSFMSSDLKVYFAERGIASSRSTSYHPTGNSQCERTNQTVWKTQLLLHHRGWLEER